jgi:hypothetical protein
LLEHIREKEISDLKDFPKFLDPGGKHANRLPRKRWYGMTEMLEVVFSVWVKKLSYARHH